MLFPPYVPGTGVRRVAVLSRPGCAPEAQWCGGGYDAQTPYYWYQLVVKVPSNAKGVVITQVDQFQKPVV